MNTVAKTTGNSASGGASQAAAPMRRGISSSVHETVHENDPALPPRPSPPLEVAVSDCLTGAAVRFDAGHKRSSLCHDQLTGLFEFRGICPEVAIGMGVPRDPIRLVGDVAAPRARGIKDAGVDVTDALQDFARRTVPSLADVYGYIFIKSSPTCGLYRVKVFPRADAAPVMTGRGVYAAAIVSARPDLPVEESGRLEDPGLRENFVTRVFAFAHWQALVAAGLSAARIVAFHSAYKYLLMAHSVPHYQQAGRLLADLSGDVHAIARTYIALLMTGLTRPATRGGHTNVLQHLQGYVTDDLDAPARHELAACIDSYRRGEVPLLAPLTLLRHHLRRVPDAYVLNPVYLEPHPPARKLLA
jgi:uncharacterized protein YbgA (DUF1722 family)/uncharacterized protein YbbK (DUF523 family)